MIAKLNELQHMVGDVELLITDGFNCNCYQGDYEVTAFFDGGETFVDSGVGGLDEI
jgi:hypothetical protein